MNLERIPPQEHAQDYVFLEQSVKSLARVFDELAPKEAAVIRGLLQVFRIEFEDGFIISREDDALNLREASAIVDCLSRTPQKLLGALHEVTEEDANRVIGRLQASPFVKAIHNR